MYSENLSGNIGCSVVFALRGNHFLELDLDVFYFAGINGDMIIPSIPKSYGSIFNVNYIYSSKIFNFILFAGVSFTKFYSYEVEEYSGGWMPGFSCTSRDHPIWTDFYVYFPLGVGITWK